MAENAGKIVFEHEERCTRVAYVEEGRRISDLAIYDRWMWLGKARLHVGGIGDVGTHERSRNRGLARQVLGAAVDWMASRFDISMLFGIPDFYGRFGYATCIPEYRASLSVRDAGRARQVMPSRPFVAEDLPVLLEAHGKRFADTVGGFDRASSWHDPRHVSSGFGRRAKIRVFQGTDGETLGYLVYDDLPHQANVAEVVACAGPSLEKSAAVYETAVALMAGVARGRGLAGFEVCLPPTDPFVLHCRRYGCSTTTSYQRDRGGMARLCNLRSALERMLPEFEGRLPPKMLGLWLKTDLGDLGLVREGAGLRLTEKCVQGLPTLSLPQSLLTVLLMGYRAVEEVASGPECHAHPAALEVAQALFPLREPFVPAPDRF